MSRSISLFFAASVVATLTFSTAISSMANAAASTAPSSTRSLATACRPLQVRNTKGAKSYSVSKGQHVIHCTGADGRKDRGASRCTENLPCANGSVCNMKMTCATSDNAS